MQFQCFMKTLHGFSGLLVQGRGTLSAIFSNRLPVHKHKLQFTYKFEIKTDLGMELILNRALFVHTNKLEKY